MVTYVSRAFKGYFLISVRNVTNAEILLEYLY